MLENAWYSVISPEMCAQILWKDTARAEDAAAVLRLTASDLLRLGVIDEVLSEPLGGAHRDPAATAATMKEAILRHLSELSRIPSSQLIARRLERYRRIGQTRPAGW